MTIGYDEDGWKSLCVDNKKENQTQTQTSSSMCVFEGAVSGEDDRQRRCG